MRVIKPLQHLAAKVRIPGSKSFTQRALVIAALAAGESRLENVLIAEDTATLAEALSNLGAAIEPADDAFLVRGTGGLIRRPDRELRLGNNGTALRLLTAVASLCEGPIVLTGSPRLQERPLLPLITALQSLGARIETEGQRGYAPATIRGGHLSGKDIVFQNIDSSQYISALLIAAPYAETDVTVILAGKIPSLPYVALTLEAMVAFGADVEASTPNRYRVKSGQRYRGRPYRIEGDLSSASYFFLAAALTGGQVRVEPISPETRQGDYAFLDVLQRLGCSVVQGKDYVEVTGGQLPGGEMTFEMAAMPDMVPTLAVLLAVRPGRSQIRGAAHLRIKESDRLAALTQELRKTGIHAEELQDGLAIEGGTPRGTVIETYQDHRIAMSFAVLGLVIPGMKITGPDCVAKSFPGFWKTLEGLY